MPGLENLGENKPPKPQALKGKKTSREAHKTSKDKDVRGRKGLADTIVEGERNNKRGKALKENPRCEQTPTQYGERETNTALQEEGERDLLKNRAHQKPYSRA